MAADAPRPDDFDSLLEELRWRGLLHQCTDEPGLVRHLASPESHRRRAYAGFDPTADSLTIGNLVAIMLLVHLARWGHEPVVVMGGGTGLIGDPSGKEAERRLMMREQVEDNVYRQSRVFESVFNGAGLASPQIINNIKWLEELKYIDVLRDFGKHFSVNQMIQKDSVRERLHTREQGISYTEFSYMILQAIDFLHLHNELNVTVQMGGSDQWGNIVTGCDLIRRKQVEAPEQLNPLGQTTIVQAGPDDERTRQLASVAGAFHTQPRPQPVFGLTAPLITKSDGGKFGKTESGAIWLTADRTSPYQFYQFWVNADDDDAVRYLKLFTLLPKSEIQALAQTHAQNPAARHAQRALARAATAIVHGPDEAARAEKAAAALFSGDVADLPEKTLEEVLAGAPSTDHPRADLDAGVPLLDLLVRTGLASSKRQAREFLAAGSVTVNGRKVGPEAALSPSDLLHGRLIALRRGKKSWHLTRWG